MDSLEHAGGRERERERVQVKLYSQSTLAEAGRYRKTDACESEAQ